MLHGGLEPRCFDGREPHDDSQLFARLSLSARCGRCPGPDATTGADSVPQRCVEFRFQALFTRSRVRNDRTVDIRQLLSVLRRAADSVLHYVLSACRRDGSNEFLHSAYYVDFCLRYCA